jgi:hypothetical protein
MHSPLSHRVRCRQIVDSDISSLADLLTRGFPIRSRQYWLNGLARLANHPTPIGFPKFGYVLESVGMLVGVILLITSSIQTANALTVRCNISSWFVEPTFRSHAAFLISRAVSRPDITYLNISAARHTRRTAEAQGFSQYSAGQFVAFAGLQRGTAEAKVVEVEKTLDVPLEPFERDLLVRHSGYGCLSLWCETAEGAYPFVFVPRMVKGVVPCVELIYCRDISDYVRFARPLGWHLALRGRPLVLIDSNGPIPGLRGLYFNGATPKYFKGPERPRLGDLAYTEAAVFGI